MSLVEWPLEVKLYGTSAQQSELRGSASPGYLVLSQKWVLTFLEHNEADMRYSHVVRVSRSLAS